MVLTVKVLTPTRVIWTLTADEVILPGLTGQLGVLDGHIPLVTALDTGLFRIKLNQKWTPLLLYGGLAEIRRNIVTVLVNEVEELMDIKLEEVTESVKKATLEIEQATNSKERLDASVELKKANARLEALNYSI